jgi:MFS family permease
MKRYVFVVGFSEFASRMNFMALSMWLLSFPNAAWYLTAFFIVRQIGGIISSFISGIIVDQFDRRKIMLWSDGVNGFAVLIPVIYPHPVAICVSAFILGITYQLFYVSYSSSIPDMFGLDRSERINALIVRIASVVSITGFLIGGWVTEYLGHLSVIVFDSLTYIVAALYLAKIRWNSNPLKNHKVEDVQTSLLDSFRRNRMIALLVFTSFFYTLAVSAYNYSLPMLASTFKHEALTNGLFWATASAGAFVGTLYKNKNKSFTSYLMFLLIFAVSINLAFSGLIPHLWILVFLFIAGGFDGIAQVNVNTMLQRAPSNERGKVFSLQGLFSRIGFFVGFLICPIIVQSFSIKVNVWSLNGLFILWISLVFLIIIVGEKNGKNSRYSIN